MFLELEFLQTIWIILHVIDWYYKKNSILFWAK